MGNELIGGRYRLEHRIASGGMASVWEAVDEILARRVAVKLLHPHLAADEQFVARFKREAVAAARLAHPSIVSIFDTCSSPGSEAIVMELVRGTTLRAELDRRGRFEPDDAIAVVGEIADALQAAHDAGIVHRDVKPANVLLSADGRVLVADFGIAKAVDGLELTNEGTTLGTAKYLAPEQVEGRPVDGRADVYATGVILYELVCGRPPFLADTEAATALARLHREPDPPSSLRADLPPPLEAVILHALARDPDRRIASAGALRDELRALGRGTAPTPITPPPVPPPSGPTADATGTIDATAAAAAASDATRATAPPPVPPVPPPAHPSRVSPAQPSRVSPAQPSRVSPAQPSPRRRRWGLALTLTLILIAAVTAIVLAIQAGDGRGGGRFDRGPGTGLDGVTASSFDPEGDDGEENEDQAGFAVDGDPTTAWRSSCYSSASFGNLKAGVGLVLALGQSTSIDEVGVLAAPDGWSATVHVADEPSDTLEGWGPAVGQLDGGSGEEGIPLDGAEGGFVLVFFTALGSNPAPECSNFPFGISVAELVVGQD